MEDKSKAYQRIKQRLTLFNLLLTPCLLFITLALPVNSFLLSQAGAVENDYLRLLLYFLYFSLWMLLFDLPLSFYSSYTVEHQFGLSNQNLGAWTADFLKKSVLSFFVSALLLCGLYALIWHSPLYWWLWAWAGFVLFSYGMGKVFPVFIVPLFYKYGRVENQDLVQRILNLGNRYQLPIENVYSLNLSKTTKKANAAFMGMGKTKRVVLSDTLLDNFTPDEIETVVAHELGHFKHGDIVKQLVTGALFSLISFFIAFKLIASVASMFGLNGAGDIGALPVLFLIFYGIYLILTPLQNAFSRWMEQKADLFSLQAFPHPAIFISCMQKLATVNLADSDPHPLYEWFFYDHPAIRKRIEMAKRWKPLVVFMMGVFLSSSLLYAAPKEEKQESNIEKRQKLEIMSFFAKPPGQAEVPSAPISVNLYNQAVDHYKKQEYELARQMAEQALQLDSSNSYGYELLGEIYYIQQKLKEAKENFQIAYSLQPRPEVKAKLEKLTKETKVESKFSTYTEEHFIIKYHNSNKSVEGFELRELLRNLYRSISQDFAHYLNYQIIVLLYNDKDFKEITERPHWSSGLYDGKVRMPLKQSAYVDKELKALTRHEVTHAFVAAMSKLTAPAWINEGLAVYEEDKERKYDLTIFKAAIKTKTLYPIDLLTSQKHLASISDALAVGLFYQQSFQLVNYIIDRYGMYTIKKMLQAFSENKSSDEVIREVLQISPQKLEAEWKSTFTH